MALVLVYSVQNRASFDAITAWVRLNALANESLCDDVPPSTAITAMSASDAALALQIGPMSGVPGAILVGTHGAGSFWSGPREVSSEEGEKLAAALSVPFREVSARNEDSVVLWSVGLRF